MGFLPGCVGYNTYCNARRAELHGDGYTILRGVLKGSEVGSDADSVIRHFSRRWIGEKETGRRQQPWHHIFNLGTVPDRENAKNGVGRYTVDVKHLVDGMIRRHEDIFKSRIRVETALGVIVDYVIQDDNEESPLRFPVTGSRLLFHTRNAEPQRPHYDFGNVEYVEGTMPWRPGSKDLSYFAMVSGAEGFHLRVWIDGHRMLYGPFDLAHDIAETLKSELIYIPPYSVLLVRGDLPHAGVGGAEADGPASLSVDEMMHIRFHMYIAHNFELLKDGVYVAHHNLRINDVVRESISV